MRLYIEKYSGTRFFALNDLDATDHPLYGQLLAVFVYKTGAERIKKLLEEMERELHYPGKKEIR